MSNPANSEPAAPIPAKSEACVNANPGSRLQIGGLLWRNTASIGLARAGSIILDALAYLLSVRYLGPAEYGYYISMLAFLNLADLAADMTVMDITVREMSKEQGNGGEWLAAGSILRMALAGLGLGAYALYVVVSNYPRNLMQCAWIAALILPVGALRMPLALFRARMKMHYELAIVLTTRLVNLLLFIAVTHWHGSMYQFFLATLGSRALFAVLAWGAAYAFLGSKCRMPGWRLWHLVRESIPMALSGTFVAIQLKADILLLARTSGPAIAGLYGAVAQLPEYSLYIPVILSTPVLPMLSRFFAESAKKDFQALYDKMFLSIVAAAIPLLVVALVMPTQTVTLLFGARYMEAGTLLPILALSIVAMWISHATAIAAVAAGLQSSFIWIQSVCMGVYLVLDIILIPYWGGTAAACVRFITAFIAPALTIAVLRRRAQFHMRLRGLYQLILAGAVMTLALYFCSGLPLLAAAAAACLVYGAVLWGFRRSILTTA